LPAFTSGYFFVYNSPDLLQSVVGTTVLKGIPAAIGPIVPE
jgi:hypothetical protein